MERDNHFHLIELRNSAELALELVRAGYSGEASACFPGEWARQEELFKAGSVRENFGAAYGIHPMVAHEVTREDLRTLGEVLERNAGAAVGECGLDKRFGGYEPGGAQERILRAQLDLAKTLGRKLTIHCVGDCRRILRLLGEAAFPSDLAVYFHRFPGDAESVKTALRYSSSFGNPKHPEFVPRELLRLETDADKTFNREGETAAELATRLIETLEARRKTYFG